MKFLDFGRLGKRRKNMKGEGNPRIQHPSGGLATRCQELESRENGQSMSRHHTEGTVCGAVASAQALYVPRPRLLVGTVGDRHAHVCLDHPLSKGHGQPEKGRRPAHVSLAAQ